MKTTPRTDHEVQQVWLKSDDSCVETWAEKDGDTIDVVDAEFARELERELDEAKTLAGELIAMIRLNVMRDTFRDATIEQVDEHLRPWIERLNGKARQL